MDIERVEWGSHDGSPVYLYTLDNGRGATAKITNYGGILTSLCLPGYDGSSTDVVLGFDTLDEYRAAKPYFGAMVGRVGNRIGGGRFELDGVTYRLATNDGANHLHGGDQGFDKVVWDAKRADAAGSPMLRLRYHSPDGDEGYPGAVDVLVDYVLGPAGELRIDMSATTDAPTPINLVHHSYWNLAGHGEGTILDHELQLNASHYTPTDADLIPTGEIAPVEGTIYDFRTPKPIGTDLPKAAREGNDGDAEPSSEVAQNTSYDTSYDMNYDTNYVIDRSDHGRAYDLFYTAQALEPASGRLMALYATMPGVQLYAGHFVDGIPGKAGATYDKYGGFCLETQYFPDAINERGTPGWPDPVLRPGQTYHHRMLHRFGQIAR